MVEELTPQGVIDRVTRAHMPLTVFLAKAKVGTSSFYRWQNGEANLSRVTMQKIRDGLEKLERLP